MIDTNNTLYPKDKALSPSSTDANVVYWQSVINYHNRQIEEAVEQIRKVHRSDYEEYYHEES